MVKVVMGDKFLLSVFNLPKKSQTKAMELFNKLKVNYKDNSLNFEAVKGATDDKMYSLRIDYTYRCIVSYRKNPTTFVLLWADHHDEAYAWAMNKKCNVNTKTGCIQIYETKLEKRTPAAPLNIEKMLFADLKDKTLLKLGVPEEQITYIRSFFNQDDFFANAKDNIPNDAYEALSWILLDIPVEEVIDMLEDAKNTSYDSDDLSSALECPLTLKNFVVIDSDDELKFIMDKPLEKWRVFLHPAQRKVVNKNFNGPARVLGGAGTGKTVVAMHRAKYLAAKICEAGTDDKILFTTFTKNLAGDIEENLKSLCTAEEMKHIEVTNIDSWVSSYLWKNFNRATVIYNDDKTIKQLWDEAVSCTGGDSSFNTDFYIQEWNSVIVPNEVYEKAEYISVLRTGRGTRINRPARVKVYNVFRKYIENLKLENKYDIGYAMFMCKQAIETKGALYKHVIVDEGQDLSNAAYRMLRAIAGKQHENDIFIVGDSHQRIYNNKPILSKCGIEVRGRSSTLKINYRTTEEIRRYAVAVLQGLNFDSLDEEEVDSKCQSLTHGTKPAVQCFKSREEEIAFITKEVKRLQQHGVNLRDICITARTNKNILDMYKVELKKSFDIYDIQTNSVDDKNSNALRMATMHRIKGLEFQYVFIVSANDDIIPLQWAIANEDKSIASEAIKAEKCLLYVALTRAQKAVYISGYGKISSFVV